MASSFEDIVPALFAKELKSSFDSRLSVILYHKTIKNQYKSNFCSYFWIYAQKHAAIFGY